MQTQEKEERNSLPYSLHGAGPSAKSPFSRGILLYPFEKKKKTTLSKACFKKKKKKKKDLIVMVQNWGSE